MNTMQKSLQDLEKALPQNFDFYHLGEVEQSQLEFEPIETYSIAFQISGDMKALIILLFDKQLDLSTYSELGNIFASKIVNYLSKTNGMELVLSTPEVLTDKKLNQITKSNQLMIRRTYGHFYENLVIPIETLILPATVEDFGNA